MSIDFKEERIHLAAVEAAHFGQMELMTSAKRVELWWST